jgi:2-oxo-4-hydroxy-4-carboxy-5-ureidoimidazoline decarboxylase
LTINELNQLAESQALTVFLSTCHSLNWAKQMVAARPFSNSSTLLDAATTRWFKLNESDWLEAFLAHPKIGNINSLREKYSNTAHLAANEQSGVQSANADVLNQLVSLNAAYEQKFGFIFIIFASGKTAQEMLDQLKLRIVNSRDIEIKNAAIEQNKITKLRLEKL